MPLRDLSPNHASSVRILETHLGTTHNLDILPDPNDERKLLAERVLVIGVLYAHKTKRRPGRVELGGELGEAAGAGRGEGELVRAVRLGMLVKGCGRLGVEVKVEVEVEVA
jgi:hypothetical protein